MIGKMGEEFKVAGDDVARIVARYEVRGTIDPDGVAALIASWRDLQGALAGLVDRLDEAAPDCDWTEARAHAIAALGTGDMEE
jgi:hypothetical protein